jgi:cyclopropane fatty-acyl-phospholipid synthase-like methyltransferase
MKTSDNTPLIEIDRFAKPATSTMIDRYAFATHWAKDKTVLDAATGKGYGAGILLALGSKSVVGIDIDEEGIQEANDKYQSPNCKFEVADIFNLKERFKENEFQVCTSIETFEHLPPEQIDDYLQNLKYVTRETIIITTPRRKTPTWEYQGGTHLYEYDSKEFHTILRRNFGDDFTVMGINEIQLPGGQWGSDLNYVPNTCWVFFAVINVGD